MTGDSLSDDMSVSSSAGVHLRHSRSNTSLNVWEDEDDASCYQPACIHLRRRAVGSHDDRKRSGEGARVMCVRVTTRTSVNLIAAACG